MSIAYIIRKTLLQLVYRETIAFQSIQIKNLVACDCIQEALCPSVINTEHYASFPYDYLCFHFLVIPELLGFSAICSGITTDLFKCSLYSFFRLGNQSPSVTEYMCPSVMILLFTFYFFTLSLCINHNVMEFWALLLFYNALITDYENYFQCDVPTIVLAHCQGNAY